MKSVCDIRKCTGCGACSAICPHGAVVLTEGKLGALYSHIDQDKCVDCGLCTRVCHVTNPVDLRYPSAAYASYSKSDSDRRTCASGGLATALSHAVISAGGVVYGCAQQKGAVVAHIRVDSTQDIELLKGSKYVQSLTKNIFKEVRKDLQEGRQVVFIGTPCQAAALKNFINEYLQERLVIADLCCHGTPSQKLLTDHLDYIGVPSRADKVIFRDKCDGAIDYVLRVYDKSGDVFYDAPARRDFYMTGFLSGLFHRESCFECTYAASDRCSDLTLADYWSIGKSTDSEMKVAKGLSAVLINTPKGKELFDLVSNNIRYEERPIAEALQNGQFIRPVDKPDDYDIFAEYYKECGYEASCRKFVRKYQRRMLIHKLKSLYYKWPLRQHIRTLLKR